MKNKTITKANKYEYLLKHPCVDCGEYDPALLEFDHVRGIKDDNVSNLISKGYSWTKILQEIDKCDVRCGKCHKARHAGNPTDPDKNIKIETEHIHRESRNKYVKLMKKRKLQLREDETHLMKDKVYRELHEIANYFTEQITRIENLKGEL